MHQLAGLLGRAGHTIGARQLVSRPPAWGSDGGNGYHVAVTQNDELNAASRARHLFALIRREADYICPNVPDFVLEVLTVQYVATLVDLEEHA